MQTTLFEHFQDGHEEITRALNIITLFEDVATGKRGKQVYDYLANHLGTEFECNHQVWKLDVLSTPSLRELAAMDVAETDILIVSIKGDRDLAPEVKSWLDVWVGQRGAPVALVLLFDPDHKTNETALHIRRYVEEVARLGQIEFFSQSEHAACEFDGPAVDLGEQRRFDFEEHSTEERSNDRICSRWGIND